MSDTRRQAHYVFSTHWDREWYQTFQDYRYRLVGLIDQVLDGMASDDFQGPFQMDGQAILLEDYLEVRKHRADEVRQLVREGKLIVGPWYVLPDEFLVSGESIIRNIQRGRAIARQYGAEPSNAGFVCDLFGHTGQLPQIMAGFGIKGGFLWRGINTDAGRARWRGADGTEMICYIFGLHGYCGYAVEVRDAANRAAELDEQTISERLDNHLDREVRRLGDRSDVPILLFDGGDHQFWDKAVYQFLRKQFQGQHDRFDICHSDLDSYLEKFLQHADSIEHLLEGELRDPGRKPIHEDNQWLIPGVLSSRVWIKQDNAACETLLCDWVEPMGVLANVLTGSEYPADYLDVAWQWLIKNHPHDSICGCSIDQVHEDMKFRFSQCKQIGERLTTESLGTITRQVEGDLGDDELRVGVFNPLTVPVEDVVELTIDVPDDWPKFQEFFGFEAKPAFRIFGAEGNELAYQRLGQSKSRYETVIRETRFPFERKVQPIRVAVRLSLPGVGYTTLTVKPGQEDVATRHPTRPGLATSERSFANEHLDVTIEPNGTLTMIDKRTGQRYERLLTFEDIADIGDGWYHGQAANDFACLSTAAHADVECLCDTPLITKWRVRVHLSVPVEFDFDHMRRTTEQRQTLVIDNTLTLKQGSDHLDVETFVNNTVKDHRLRVLLPTGANASTFIADSAFDVVERPIALREDNHEYRELEVETKPQQSWSAVFDDQRGMAVMAEGLKETAVIDKPERTLALTLYRSTRRTVMTAGEPNGQLLMPLSFRYCIAPLQGQPDVTHLQHLARRLNAGTRAVQLRSSELADTDARKLSATFGLIESHGPAVVTSAQQSEAGLVLRAYNPTDQVIEHELVFASTLAGKVSQTQPIDFEGHAVGEPIAINDGQLSLTFQPKQMQTLLLQSKA